MFGYEWGHPEEAQSLTSKDGASTTLSGNNHKLPLS